MAAEPWNRLNIPFPSALSSVRIHFSPKTDVNVKNLLVENGKVLTLIRSEILQTEIRLLYELLHILNNSYKGNKTFKGLKQVEQCINRLKNMKLDVALQELTDLCPNRIQRGLAVQAGECDVPSQPKLEWLCLKVLGAAHLMSCTLNRCSRAFVLSKQQMKVEEFVILNVVITSLLSRLWVIFRGVLASLSTLYQQLLEFLKEVAHVRPMPFLTGFSLPGDMAQFLDPSHALLLTKQHNPCAKDRKEKQQRRKNSVKVKNRGQNGKFKEDLGVAIQRDLVLDADMTIFRNLTEGKSLPQESHKAEKKQTFKQRARKATTFTDMASHLEEMILWCKSQKMKKEKRILTFLRLKCRRMKCLEAAGYNVQRKLQTFRQEASRAFSPHASVPNTCWSFAAARRNAHMRTRFQSLRRRLKSHTVSIGVKKKQRVQRRRKKTELSTSGPSEDDERSRTVCEAAAAQTTDYNSHDDIDDIFAAVGF
ncbi:hypothetical protein PAMA_003451 [Pampus argenteus]